VRPTVQSILDQLLVRHRSTGRVDLNDIAEVIDARAVTYDEVELIIAGLEAEGLAVGEPLTGHDVGIMRSVIVTAHKLAAKLRRRPTVEEIAVESGHPPYAVRRALEHGKNAARAPLAAKAM
jgi:hypothetical protein